LYPESFIRANFHKPLPACLGYDGAGKIMTVHAFPLSPL